MISCLSPDLSAPCKIQNDTNPDIRQPPKAIPIDRTNIQVSAEDLIKTKLSTESLRVAISYMNHPKLLAGIYPQKIANWMVAKVDEVASFVSQLQAR